MNDINNQKLIYFNSPWGTGERIYDNLWLLGLDKNKTIGKTYLNIFMKDLLNDLLNKYYEYDVLYIDGFYYREMKQGIYTNGHEIDGETVERETINAILKLVENGKQIVMASHDYFETIKISQEFKSHVVVYDLKYKSPELNKMLQEQKQHFISMGDNLE